MAKSSGVLVNDLLCFVQNHALTLSVPAICRLCMQTYTTSEIFEAVSVLTDLTKDSVPSHILNLSNYANDKCNNNEATVKMICTVLQHDNLKVPQFVSTGKYLPKRNLYEDALSFSCVWDEIKELKEQMANNHAQLIVEIRELQAELKSMNNRTCSNCLAKSNLSPSVTQSHIPAASSSNGTLGMSTSNPYFDSAQMAKLQQMQPAERWMTMLRNIPSSLNVQDRREDANSFVTSHNLPSPDTRLSEETTCVAGDETPKDETVNSSQNESGTEMKLLPTINMERGDTANNLKRKRESRDLEDEVDSPKMSYSTVNSNPLAASHFTLSQVNMASTLLTRMASIEQAGNWCQKLENILDNKFHEIRNLQETTADLLSHVIRHSGVIPPLTQLPSDVVFPLMSVTDVVNLEQKLEDPTTQQTVVNHLSLVGGSSTKECTRRILKTVLSNKLAQHMNWKGKGDKIAFSNFRLRDIINRAVRTNTLTGEATNYEIEAQIKSWLRFAPAREGGRKENSSKPS